MLYPKRDSIQVLHCINEEVATFVDEAEKREDEVDD